MMKKASIVAALVVLVAVMLLGTAHETRAVPCDPIRLSACLGAVLGRAEPSEACCNGLKGQKECYCTYKKIPIYGPYVDSPVAREVATKCGVEYPTTCTKCT